LHAENERENGEMCSAQVEQDTSLCSGDGDDLVVRKALGLNRVKKKKHIETVCLPM